MPRSARTRPPWEELKFRVAQLHCPIRAHPENEFSWFLLVNDQCYARWAAHWETFGLAVIDCSGREEGAGRVFNLVWTVGAPSTYRQEPGERGNKFHSASRLWRSNIEPKSTPLPPPPLRLEKHFPPSPPHQLPSAQKRFIVCRLALLFLPPYERAWVLVIWRSFRRPSRTWTPGIVPYPCISAATDYASKTPRATPPCSLAPLSNTYLLATAASRRAEKTSLRCRSHNHPLEARGGAGFLKNPLGG